MVDGSIDVLDNSLVVESDPDWLLPVLRLVQGHGYREELGRIRVDALAVHSVGIHGW